MPLLFLVSSLDCQKVFDTQNLVTPCLVLVQPCQLHAVYSCLAQDQVQGEVSADCEYLAAFEAIEDLVTSDLFLKDCILVVLVCDGYLLVSLLPPARFLSIGMSDLVSQSIDHPNKLLKRLLFIEELIIPVAQFS